MINIMVIVSPEKLYTYRLTDSKCELVHIHGDNGFPYQQRSAGKSLRDYIAAIKEEFGYETVSVFSVKALFLNENLKRGFMGAVNMWNEKNKERRGEFLDVLEDDFNKVAKSVFYRLEKDKSFRINEFGVNVGIFCYKFNNKKMVRTQFSLTAYTVELDRLGEFV